jgi:hypothetical protein
MMRCGIIDRFICSGAGAPTGTFTGTFTGAKQDVAVPVAYEEGGARREV